MKFLESCADVVAVVDSRDIVVVAEVGETAAGSKGTIR